MEIEIKQARKVEPKVVAFITGNNLVFRNRNDMLNSVLSDGVVYPGSLDFDQYYERLHGAIPLYEGDSVTITF